MQVAAGRIVAFLLRCYSEISCCCRAELNRLVVKQPNRYNSRGGIKVVACCK